MIRDIRPIKGRIYQKNKKCLRFLFKAAVISGSKPFMDLVQLRGDIDLLRALLDAGGAADAAFAVSGR